MADTRPTVTSFVGTFLKPEMWHVYNQVNGIKDYRSLVITRERRNETLFPHGGVHLLTTFPVSIWERFRLKYIEKQPQLVYRGIIPSLVSQLNGLETDLLHIYFGHEATRLAPLFDHWDKPIVVSFHGADLGRYVRRPDDIIWLPTVFKRAKLILARCEYFVPFLLELGCPPEKIRINRTHIPLELYSRVERKFPQDGAWNLMQACRMMPKKGLLTTLRAFAEFHKKYPNSTLTLAGDGPQLAVLQKEVWALGLTRSVFFVGFVDRDALRQLYHQSHFFLHPSETDSANDIEGIPNSLLEAMCTGLPSFSTQHAGIPEAVTDGKDGFLLPEKDHEAFAAKLIELTQDEALYQRVSLAATQKIHDVYRPQLQIDALQSYYAEALRS